MRHRFFATPTPVVIGHRGAAGSAPENTLAGFEQGLQLGAQILESDIHATRDGIPVLIHDASLDRTSDGRGLVSDIGLDALRELDAGHHFSLDEGTSFPMRGRRLGIPTLEEAFAAFPDARFNLEIKGKTPGLVERVVALVAQFERAEFTLLAAGENQIMDELRRVLARSEINPATGASTGEIGASLRALSRGTPAPGEPMALQVPVAFGGRPLITRELIEFAHTAEIAVHAWTINDPDEMRRLLDVGVDGIITDYPERFVEVLRAK